MNSSKQTISNRTKEPQPQQHSPALQRDNNIHEKYHVPFGITSQITTGPSHHTLNSQAKHTQQIIQSQYYSIDSVFPIRTPPVIPATFQMNLFFIWKPSGSSGLQQSSFTLSNKYDVLTTSFGNGTSNHGQSAVASGSATSHSIQPYSKQKSQQSTHINHSEQDTRLGQNPQLNASTISKNRMSFASKLKGFLSPTTGLSLISGSASKNSLAQSQQQSNSSQQQKQQNTDSFHHSHSVSYAPSHMHASLSSQQQQSNYLHQQHSTDKTTESINSKGNGFLQQQQLHHSNSLQQQQQQQQQQLQGESFTSSPARENALLMNPSHPQYKLYSQMFQQLKQRKDIPANTTLSAATANSPERSSSSKTGHHLYSQSTAHKANISISSSNNLNVASAATTSTFQINTKPSQQQQSSAVSAALNSSISQYKVPLSSKELSQQQNVSQSSKHNQSYQQYSQYQSQISSVLSQNQSQQNSIKHQPQQSSHSPESKKSQRRPSNSVFTSKTPTQSFQNTLQSEIKRVTGTSNAATGINDLPNTASRHSTSAFTSPMKQLKLGERKGLHASTLTASATNMHSGSTTTTTTQQFQQQQQQSAIKGSNNSNVAQAAGVVPPPFFFPQWYPGMATNQTTSATLKTREISQQTPSKQHLSTSFGTRQQQSQQQQQSYNSQHLPVSSGQKRNISSDGKTAAANVNVQDDHIITSSLFSNIYANPSTTSNFNSSTAAAAAATSTQPIQPASSSNFPLHRSAQSLSSIKVNTFVQQQSQLPSQQPSSTKHSNSMNVAIISQSHSKDVSRSIHQQPHQQQQQNQQQLLTSNSAGTTSKTSIQRRTPSEQLYLNQRNTQTQLQHYLNSGQNILQSNGNHQLIGSGLFSNQCQNTSSGSLNKSGSIVAPKQIINSSSPAQTAAAAITSKQQQNKQNSDAINNTKGTAAGNNIQLLQSSSSSSAFPAVNNYYVNPTSPWMVKPSPTSSNSDVLLSPLKNPSSRIECSTTLNLSNMNSSKKLNVLNTVKGILSDLNHSSNPRECGVEDEMCSTASHVAATTASSTAATTTATTTDASVDRFLNALLMLKDYDASLIPVLNSAVKFTRSRFADMARLASNANAQVTQLTRDAKNNKKNADLILSLHAQIKRQDSIIESLRKTSGGGNQFDQATRFQEVQLKNQSQILKEVGANSYSGGMSNVASRIVELIPNIDSKKRLQEQIKRNIKTEVKESRRGDSLSLLNAHHFHSENSKIATNELSRIQVGKEESLQSILPIAELIEEPVAFGVSDQQEQVEIEQVDGDDDEDYDGGDNQYDDDEDDFVNSNLLFSAVTTTAVVAVPESVPQHNNNNNNKMNEHIPVQNLLSLGESQSQAQGGDSISENNYINPVSLAESVTGGGVFNSQSEEGFVPMQRPVIKKLQLNNLHKTISPPKKVVVQSEGGVATQGTVKLDGFEVEDISGMGYHDEFMSRMNEFSLSWRKAAENERKPHSQF